VTAIGSFSGVALECPDPAALAEFYHRLTGWPVVYSGTDWYSLGPTPDADWHLSFQRAPGYRPPTWPDPASSMQAHLHIRVDDLDAAEQAVRDLGGARCAVQPDPAGSRVMTDPAGHPFCLVRRR